MSAERADTGMYCPECGASLYCSHRRHALADAQAKNARLEAEVARLREENQSQRDQFVLAVFDADQEQQQAEQRAAALEAALREWLCLSATADLERYLPRAAPPEGA